jgi:hypothetical protein
MANKLGLWDRIVKECYFSKIRKTYYVRDALQIYERMPEHFRGPEVCLEVLSKNFHYHGVPKEVMDHLQERASEFETDPKIRKKMLATLDYLIRNLEGMFYSGPYKVVDKPAVEGSFDVDEGDGNYHRKSVAGESEESHWKGGRYLKDAAQEYLNSLPKAISEYIISRLSEESKKKLEID